MADGNVEEKVKLKCGIVMPISAIDGCSEGHWLEVKDIITDAISSAGFVGDLVSQADYSSVIHERIIQNLYNSDIVVCDVSCKNANVMFELGMRLAFNKPTIVIKDDKTGYSFDTSPIEHLEYPRDLRFAKIVSFKDELAKKISSTYLASKKEDYKTFLQNFGQFTVAKIDRQEIGVQDYILEELKRVVEKVDRLSSNSLERNSILLGSLSKKNKSNFDLGLLDPDVLRRRMKYKIDVGGDEGRIERILAALDKENIKVVRAIGVDNSFEIDVLIDESMVHMVDKVISEA